MKRADSSELLSVTSQNKRNWTPPRKLANSNLSETGESGILCKKISRVDSLSRCNKTSSADSNNKSNSDLSQINMRNLGGKLYKSTRKKRSLSSNIPLSQQQLTSYMNLLQLNSSQIDDMLNDLAGNANESQQPTSIARKTDLGRPVRKFGMNEHSEISVISDDDNEKCDKKTRCLHESLTNVGNFLSCRKKSLSQSEASSVFISPIKSDESGYGSDSARTDIESPGFSFKSSRVNSINNKYTLTTDFNQVLDFKTQTDASKNYLSDDTDTDAETHTHENDLQTTFKVKQTLNKISPKLQQSEVYSQDSEQFVSESVPLQLNCTVSDLPDNQNQKLSDLNLKLLVHDYNVALDKLMLDLKPLKANGKETHKHTESVQQPAFNKEFKCIRVMVDYNDDVGISIGLDARCNGTSAAPYIVTDIVPNSAADR